MAADDDDSIPRGRLRRMGRLVGMTANIGAHLAAGGVKRLLGGEGDPKVAAARQLLDTLGDMKGLAQKAGQTLSLFAEDLPPDARLLLSRLLAQSPALPFEKIAPVIEEDLGERADLLFHEFEHQAFAAGSLGQVHRATLKTGEAVVVKVQFPGVAEALENDLRNVGGVLKTVGLGGAIVDGKGYLEELRREIGGELDYVRELGNLERFRAAVARWPDLVVPKAFPKLSAKRVLVLERLVGETVSDLSHHIAEVPPERRFAIGEQLVRALYGPFIYDRLMHGDAHPGNYLVLEDGRLGIVDFGCVKDVREPFWRGGLEVFMSTLRHRPIRWPELLRTAGFRINVDDAVAQKVVDEIAAVVTRPLRGPWDFAQDDTLQLLNKLKLRHPLELIRMQPPADSILIYRSIAGLGQNLRALKAAGDFRPFFEKALGELGIS